MRFARDDPETPPTMDEQIAIARKAAQKLGIPNSDAKRVTSRRMGNYRLLRDERSGATVRLFATISHLRRRCIPALS